MSKKSYKSCMEMHTQQTWVRSGVGHGPKEDIFTQIRNVYREQGAHPEGRQEMLRLLESTNLSVRKQIVQEVVRLGTFVLHCSRQELERLCDLCEVDVTANSFDLLLGCAMRFRHSWERLNRSTRELEPEKLTTVTDIVDFLLQRGANINVTNYEGLTVLQKAAEERCGLSGLHVLISRGATGLTENVALDPIKSAALRQDITEFERLISQPDIEHERVVEAMELLWAIKPEARNRVPQPQQCNQYLLKGLFRREKNSIPQKQWVTSCPFLAGARVLNSFNDLYRYGKAEDTDEHVLSAILIIEKAFGSIDAIDIEVGLAIMQMAASFCGSSALLSRILRELCVKPNFPLMLCVPVMNPRAKDLTFRNFALTCVALCRVEVPRAWRWDLVNHVRFLLNGLSGKDSPEAQVATLRSNEERTAALYAIAFTMDQAGRWGVDGLAEERWLLELVKDGANVGARGWSGRGADRNSPAALVLSCSGYSYAVQKAFQDAVGCCGLTRRPQRLVTAVEPLRCLAARLLRQYPAELTEELNHVVLRGGVILKDFVDLHPVPFNVNVSKRPRLSDASHSRYWD
ncbi:uncharacterized protein LOC111246972 isoform X3 [Varroa destructor]|uniref:Uncharacterized protein n=1 Tax=Varroa destructor TaxID=109461 RepID=A0A7M7JK59_VARDE|nr:uncharacterized protein LOC111246972 isoform X3 [Varroa destructor]